MNNEPLLSVCLITYNHVKYIREAIESVLMQKVNFAWELIIADDFSTDGTREILLEYKEKYPSFIKLILQEKNVGPAQNWLELITTPKSKYIAYFEGDDYWTDPRKLQKQVDFLQTNPAYGMVYTAATEISDDTNIDFSTPSKFKHYDGYIFYHLLNYQFIGSNSVCFLKDCININELNVAKYTCDLWLFLRIAMDYKIGFIDHVTYVHRIHSGSITMIWKADYAGKYFTLSKYEILNIFLTKKGGIKKFFNLLLVRYLLYFSFKCPYLTTKEKRSFFKKIILSVFRF